MMQDDAIAWLVRLQSDAADEGLWEAFTAWLEADDAHRAAFDAVERFDAQTAAMLQAASVDTQQKTNVIWPARFAMSRRVVSGLVALAACALIGVAVLWPGSARQIATYETAFGQTRNVTLADGSTVALNTNSKLIVDPSQGNRRVVLARGEALFHITKDKAHPFVVAVGNRFVRVVGTVFDVLRDHGAISVVVAQGKVMFTAHAAVTGAPDEIALTPGDKVVYDEATAQISRSRIDPSRAVAWRDGYLVYESAPLSQVVSDLNRYYANRIVLRNDGAANVKFSGVLKIDNQNAVVARLSQFLPVAALRQADGSVMLQLAKKPD